MFFPIVIWMWEFKHKENWVPKDWCFWTVMLEKTLESPLDIKEIQPVHPKGDHPEYPLEGLMLKLKLQYIGLPMWRTYSLERPWCWERLKAGGEGDDRAWDGQMASPIQWPWVWVGSRSWWWKGKPDTLQSMRSQRVGRDWMTELNYSWKSHWIMQEKAQMIKFQGIW